MTAFFVLVLSLLLCNSALAAHELLCPLAGCSPASQPSGDLSFCAHYGELSCCSPSSASALASAVEPFIGSFSSASCRAALEDIACGFRCSAAQADYVELFDTQTLAAEYRVCESACAAAYAACQVGTFDDEPVALRFESAGELCAALPLGGAAEVLVTRDDADAGANRTCFRSRETEQRTASLVFGEAMGGGLTLAEHTLHVRALDGFGQPVSAGGDELAAAIGGPNAFEPTVADLGNGSYTVRYRPEIGGYYDVAVRLEGDLAAQLPERVSVRAASLCPLRSDTARSAKPRFAAGAPTTCARYNENSCCVNEAQYRDVRDAQADFASTYRNNAECAAFFDAAACGVGCSPTQSIFYDPNSNSTDAAATFAFCDSFCERWYAACRDVELEGLGPVASLYASHVAFCEANAPHDDFAIVVRDALCFDDGPARTSCRDSFASGDALHDWTRGAPSAAVVRAGQQASFTVQAVDVYQNLQTRGGDGWRVAFDAPGVVPAVRDNGDGTYTVTYTATVARQYAVSVTCNGAREEIEHGPLPLRVLPAVRLIECAAHALPHDAAHVAVVCTLHNASGGALHAASADNDDDAAPLGGNVMLSGTQRRVVVRLRRVALALADTPPLREFDPNSKTFDRSLLELTPAGALRLRRREAAAAALRRALHLRWCEPRADGCRGDVDMRALQLDDASLRALLASPLDVALRTAHADTPLGAFAPLTVAVRGTDASAPPPALSLSLRVERSLGNGASVAAAHDAVVVSGQLERVDVPRAATADGATFEHTVLVAFVAAGVYRVTAVVSAPPFERVYADDDDEAGDTVVTWAAQRTDVIIASNNGDEAAGTQLN
eukprot:TRINITY_DN4826_c0_g1_i2.p1 TRINITY_DN4826_c0_g1~~TRINITY_DN4826_c0_g1_i2.p1  ORF type:complete len:840 (+),score=622.80 TRINITY_DN4826_c0_g1_i2:45-2564(+)